MSTVLHWDPRLHWVETEGGMLQDDLTRPFDRDAHLRSFMEKATRAQTPELYVKGGELWVRGYSWSPGEYDRVGLRSVDRPDEPAEVFFARVVGHMIARSAR